MWYRFWKMSKPLTSLSPTAGTLFSSSRFCSVLSSVDEVPLISEPIIHSCRHRRRPLVSRKKKENIPDKRLSGAALAFISPEKRFFFSQRVFLAIGPIRIMAPPSSSSPSLAFSFSLFPLFLRFQSHRASCQGILPLSPFQ